LLIELIILTLELEFSGFFGVRATQLTISPIRNYFFTYLDFMIFLNHC